VHLAQWGTLPLAAEFQFNKKKTLTPLSHAGHLKMEYVGTSLGNWANDNF
jgi:hypothetical protein